MRHAIAFYDVRLNPDPMGPMLDGVAEYDELREPDEWGEPGRLIRQRLRCVRLAHGEQLVPEHGAMCHLGYRYAIFDQDQRGRARWVMR